MVEHVQRRSRALAGTAALYCVATTLVWAVITPDLRGLASLVGGMFAAVTLVPQLFPIRSGFRVSCLVAAVLVTLGAFLGLIFGGLPFLPSAVLLLLAAVGRSDRKAATVPLAEGFPPSSGGGGNQPGGAVRRKAW